MKTVAKILGVILGIIIIVNGFICMFRPGITYLIIGYIVGLSMIFDAIGRFVEWGQLRKEGAADGWILTSAILSLVLGFFVLNNAVLQVGIDAFIIYYIAVWLVLHGIVVIVRAHKIRKFHTNWNTRMIGTHWYLPLILGILCILFGVLCMFKPLVLASVLGVFIGLGIISTGAGLITMALTPGL